MGHALLLDGVRTSTVRTALAALLLGAFSIACERTLSPVDPLSRQASEVITDTTSPPSTTADIVLRPTVRYQTITGWEAGAQAGYENPDFGLYSASLFNLAANDLGINRLRLNIYSGAENTQDYYVQWRKGLISDSLWRCVRYATLNDNLDANTINWNGFKFSQIDTIVQKVILPMKSQLAARGEKLFVNLTYTAFTRQICSPYHYDHDNSPQEYAEFILATSLHLRTKYGLVPDAWEVILEPDNTTFWRGNTIGNAIVATAAKLSVNGFTPRFITPSTTRSYNAVPYFDALVTQVPAAKPYLRELSYHRYSTVTLTELQTIAARAAQYGIKSSMLERIGAGYEALHADLKEAKVTAWQQFALAFGSQDDGTQYYLIDRTIASSPKVVIASRTKYLRQYFKFIRTGAVRIDAATSNTALDPLAFINTNGGYVVVVKTTGTAAFKIQGLPAGTYGIKYTTGTQYNISYPDVTLAAGQLLATSIPARGVLTVYHK